MPSFKKNAFILFFQIFLLLLMPIFPMQSHAEDLCNPPLSTTQLKSFFRQSTELQLTLQFGNQHLQVGDIAIDVIAKDLVRAEADVKYQRPGVNGPSTKHMTGFVSRCEGTTIFRKNTWLADGRLSVPRFNEAELTGKGITLGDPSAPIKILAYIDSRCPNCHRLMGYAMDLVEAGKLIIEFRQTAYLENVDEAIKDSRLFESSIIKGKEAKLTDDRYLELVGGFASDDPVNKESEAYLQAKSVIENNTRVARQVLHINAVPGVLIQESDYNNQYRIMGYWEMNRLMQPDL